MLRPVTDLDGRVLWRVRVARNELTCTGCGEVVLRSRDEHGNERHYCINCGTTDTGGWIENPPPLVPTLSYLHPEEVDLI